MPFYSLCIINQAKHFSFKSGCVIQVASNEMCNQLQPMKTNYVCILAIIITAKDISPTIQDQAQ